MAIEALTSTGPTPRDAPGALPNAHGDAIPVEAQAVVSRFFDANDVDANDVVFVGFPILLAADMFCVKSGARTFTSSDEVLEDVSAVQSSLFSKLAGVNWLCGCST